MDGCAGRLNVRCAGFAWHFILDRLGLAAGDNIEYYHINSVYEVSHHDYNGHEIFNHHANHLQGSQPLTAVCCLYSVPNSGPIF